MQQHELFMKRCLQLAELGRGKVSPNPMVGAVLVYNHKIIGEGYHIQYGGPHAEVNCLNSVAGNDYKFFSDSTLYVSLEPCSHFGKTPPCSDLIIKSGIKKVVIAMKDPNPLVAGNGISKLIDAGIDVTEGILSGEAEELNCRFICMHLKKRPYIILKWAQTANNIIGSGTKERIYISNNYSNFIVQKWRGEEDAILAGTNTVIADDPFLSNRSGNSNILTRIIIDRQLKIPNTYNIYNCLQPTVIINEVKNELSGEITFLKTNHDFSEELFSYLIKRDISSVIVEGGKETLQYFIDRNIWDEARIITNTANYEADGVVSPVLKGKLISSVYIESDKIDFIINKK